MARSVQAKNILVAGGAGFIGSHLCDELVRDETVNVICLDNFITSSIENVNHLLQRSNFEFLRHDIVEPLDLTKFPELAKFNIAAQGVSALYHLACPTSTRDYQSHPIETILASSVGTKHLLDVATHYGASVVFASTGAIYGDWEKGKVYTEEGGTHADPVGARCSYVQGKRVAECLATEYRRQHGLDVKIARIFNTYGPRMKFGSPRLVPDMITRAIQGEPLLLHGDGKETITLCYVDDVVAGLVRLMKSSVREPINVGSDEPHEIVEVAKKVLEMAESNSPITFGEAVHYSAQYAVPDIGRARERLGWFPVTNLEQGLKVVVADMKGSHVLKL